MDVARFTRLRRLNSPAYHQQRKPFMKDSEPILPQRKHNRLDGYDYSLAGAYFVTVCTHERICIFGRINAGEMQLNRFGIIVEEEWLRTGEMRPNVILDQFVIMPNHIHGIIVIDYPRLGHREASDTKQSLERIVAGFKAACTRRFNELGQDNTLPVWQKSFHDEIIRDEKHLGNVREYIVNNPAQWDFDLENRDRQLIE
jgi:putative transposase